MSKPTSNIKNLLNKKLFILISLVLLTSITHVNGLRYNRGPLEEAYPYRAEETVDDDDEFTGSTYIEPTNGENSDVDESLLEFSQRRGNSSKLTDDTDDDEEEDEDDDDDDDEEESEDFLDRADESTLLELSGESFLETSKPKSERVDDNILKQYLTKIGAIDKMKKVKEGGKRAFSGLKNKVKSIPQGVKKLKNKIIPPNPYVTTLRPEKKTGSNQGRKLDTINEVDGLKKSKKGNSHIPHGRRLLNTMNDVDSKKLFKQNSQKNSGSNNGRPRKVLHIMKDENDGIEEKEPPRYGRLRSFKQKSKK
ncbi:hypothetical protein MACK_003246 [Theileria orientalis]|uniref:Uncharacterized protein n=1 Tax=Theileria orientalis TaxID=68886 RepID=A0A976SII6_THEOR|nr:hypothetical protein MACK_003246 [Theileria orientalis]